MRRFLLSVLGMMVTAVSMQAARAWSEPRIVTQPDGTQLTVILCGDEHCHWLQTTDGKVVVRRDDGFYVPSEMPTEQGEAEAGRRASISDNYYLPHAGSPRILVILTQFYDVKFTLADPVRSFNQYFNGTTQQDFGNGEHHNHCSVQQYFSASSRGQFVPQFDVVGPVTVSQPLAHYGVNNEANIQKLIQESIDLVDPQVDFSQYAADNNDYVGGIVIIHAGYGENMGAPASSIWAKTVSVGKRRDRVYIAHASVCSELNGASAADFPGSIPWINGIGVCCHELSHCLGLPDFYPTTTEARKVNNQAMEYWDLMDYGEYLDSGYMPTPYTCWEQETMGWTEIEKLTGTRRGMTLTPLLEGGKAYKFGNGADPEEFFLIENIQQRGMNGKAYGHGLLVYHVAYAKSSVSSSDYPNNTPHKPCMTIVPADGLLISGYQTLKADGSPLGYGGTYTREEYRTSLAGDPFPGSHGVNHLTDAQQLPNYQFYNGEAATGCQLLNITENSQTGIVTLDFVRSDDTGIETVHRSYYSEQLVYDLQGRKVDINDNVNKNVKRGLYIQNGKVIVK